MSERIVGVIQARTGSTRLPAKVLAPILGWPLVRWTIEAMLAVRGIHALVLATTNEPEDDALVEAVGDLVPVHRGPAFDVLTRCWDAVMPYAPTIVVRQTADNPFVDPVVIRAQVDRLIDDGYDFVGNAGWPLGIAGEVARAKALAAAAAEAVDPAEREHVMPFLYARPDRFRIGRLAAPADPAHGRYTVDTEADLAFVRVLADRLGHAAPVALAELDAIVRADPALGAMNAQVRQKGWREVDPRRI